MLSILRKTYGFIEFMKLVGLFSLVIFSANSLAITLTHEQSAADQITITLENDKPLQINQAQAAIQPYALELCKGKYPSAGKYKFGSTESLASDASQSKNQISPSFTFVQEIECFKEKPEAQKFEKFDISKEQEELIKVKATDLTSKYLLAKESGKFEKAYEKLGSDMKNIIGYVAWEKRESDYFAEKLGDLVTRDIWKATMYNNPPNSPKPGIYVAIDYENEYEISSIHCGYVIWFMPEMDLDQLAILREEYGSIPKATVQNSTPQHLSKLREKMRCRVF